MFGKKGDFYKIVKFFNFLILILGLFFVSYIGYIKPLIRDDLKAVFGFFFSVSFRFIGEGILFSFSKLAELLNVHFLDISSIYQSILYFFIYLFFVIVIFYPYWKKNNIFCKEIDRDELSDKIISVSFPLLLFLFFLFLIFEIFVNQKVIYRENIVTYSYFMFIPFYVIFLYYQYDFLLNKSVVTNKKLFIYSLNAFIFGFSVEFLHFFWIFSFVCMSIYSFIKREHLFDFSSKRALIPICIFFICLYIYYFGNPAFLEVGFFDKQEVSYSGMYNSLLHINERFVPFFVDGFCRVVVFNKYFIISVFLLLVSFIPKLNIKNRFNKLICFQLFGMLFLFASHILIDNFESGAQLIEQAGRTFPTFLLSLFSFIVLQIYFILQGISSDERKIRNRKLIIIVFTFVLLTPNFCDSELFKQFKHAVDWNKQERVNEFIREKIYMHYLKENEVAVVPLRLHDHYEEIHEKMKKISPRDMHNDFFPLYILIKNILKEDILVNYYFADDDIAWDLYFKTGGEQINTNNIEFTSLMKEYSFHQKKK